MTSCSNYFRELWEGKRRTAGDTLLVTLLTPFAILYRFFMEKRAECYRSALLATKSLGVPVISVGNLSVGGTGKTPMVALLANSLMKRGKRVAVLSRGYGGSAKGGVRIVSDGLSLLLSPEECGDEPYLLARSVPGLIVVTGADRYRAGLMALERFNPEVFILDDGYQHLRLERNLNILLLDGRNPLGNGRTLPAGLLREPLSAVRRADLVVYTRCNDPQTFSALSDIPVCSSIHRLAGFVPLAGGLPAPFEALAGKRGVAFAGIADPESFFDALKKEGLVLLAAIPFPDHCRYTGSEVAMLLRALHQTGADYLVTTEKDAVKLAPHGDVLGESYAAVLELVLNEPRILERELDKIL